METATISSIELATHPASLPSNREPCRSKERLRLAYRYMSDRGFISSRHDLREIGFSDSQIDSWICSGRLIRVIRGVYSYGRDVESPKAAYRAALATAGPGSALTGRSACALLGLTRDPGQIPRKIDIAVPAGRNRCLQGVSPALSQTRVEIAKRRFNASETLLESGVATLIAPLALLDFAAAESTRSLRFAFLEACRLGLIGGSDLSAAYTRIAGHSGATKLRPLFGLWIPELSRIRSVLEGSFLLAWAEGGFPIPRVNESVQGYEVDCWWPELQSILELDGRAFHSDPVQRQIDMAKQRDLEQAGLKVLRITYREFDSDPSAAVNRVAHQIGLL